MKSLFEIDGVQYFVNYKGTNKATIEVKKNNRFLDSIEIEALTSKHLKSAISNTIKYYLKGELPC